MTAQACRIGVSLERKYLSGVSGEKWLSALAEMGVSSIELRDVAPGHDSASLLALARNIRAHGMDFTVHSRLTDASFERWAENLLPLYSLALERQSSFPVTVHPLLTERAEDMIPYNAEILARMADGAAAYPGFFLAYENERVRGKNPSCVCTAGCTEAWRRAARGNIGFTWDFGHYYYNMLRVANTPDAVPETEFLCHTVHTHIHALCPSRDYDTHYPIAGEEILPPPASYVAALLRAGYRGVWNLEITPNTLSEDWICAIEAIRASCDWLRGKIEKFL